MNKRAQIIERKKKLRETLDKKLRNKTQRGLGDKAKGIIPGLGEQATRIFGDKFHDLMESLRVADDSARESAIDLKYVLKDARSNANRREYMAAIVDLGQFHELLEQIKNIFSSFTGNVDDVHNEFLFGGDHLSDERKKFLYKMPEKHKKTAGIADIFHNLTSERGRALKYWEKRFPLAAKELNKQTDRMISGSEKFLAYLEATFKTLAKLRSARKFEEYLKLTETYVLKYKTYDAAFKEYFNGTARKFIERQQAFENQNAPQAETSRDTLVDAAPPSAMPAPAPAPAPASVQAPTAQDIAEQAANIDIPMPGNSLSDTNIPNPTEVVKDLPEEMEAQNPAAMVRQPAGTMVAFPPPSPRQDSLAEDLERLPKQAQNTALPFAKTLPSIEEPDWEEVTDEDLLDEDQIANNLNNPRIPTMVDVDKYRARMPAMMDMEPYRTNHPTIIDTDFEPNTEIPPEFQDTEFPKGDTLPSPYGVGKTQDIPRGSKVPDFQELMRQRTDEELDATNYWKPKGNRHVPQVMNDKMNTVVPGVLKNKIVDQSDPAKLTEEEPVVVEELAPVTFQYPYGTNDVGASGPLTEAVPNTMFSASASAFVSKLDSLKDQNPLVIAKEIIAYAKSIEKSDKASSVRLLKVAQQLIKQ